MATTHAAEESGPINKDALRQTIWSTLRQHQVVKHDPVGHIPNFIGTETATERLSQLKIWQQAQVIKCNPDSPQKLVRLHALAAGKLLYMAVPRLSRRQCFVALHGEALAAKGIPLQQAANMREALVHGQPVAFADMQPIDLVVVGSVAVSPNGGRTGKGAGFADLELAMLREAKLVLPDTPIVTTVHDLQVVASDRVPMQRHDWPLDWIVTPTTVIKTNTALPRPTGLDWPKLQPQQIQKIPVLRSLSQQQQQQQ